MSFTGEKLQILTDEVVNDPLNRGYSTMTDREVADSLNVDDRPKNRESMTSSEIFNAIDVPEFIALADGPQANIMGLMGFGELNPFGKEADVFVAIFGGGSNTISALAVARVTQQSRADELGLRRVGTGDIGDVR